MLYVMSLAGSSHKRQRNSDMADSFTRSILMKDLVALQKKPLPFAWIPDDVLIDDNILTWQMWLLGPEGTQFEGGVYKILLTFPPTYPNEPPEMRFATPLWHPNIYPDGRVCISILHKPGGTAEIPDDTPASECWRPILNIEAIIVSVLSMLSDPNFSSPANLDASVQMRNDPDGYVRRISPSHSHFHITTLRSPRGAERARDGADRGVKEARESAAGIQTACQGWRRRGN